jgi:hypothetical protein
MRAKCFLSYNLYFLPRHQKPVSNPICDSWDTSYIKYIDGGGVVQDTQLVGTFVNEAL